MIAVRRVLLTKVVARAEPFQRTPEAATKLVPFTVSVKLGVSTVTLAGLSDVMVGTGLLTVMFRLAVPPPGVGLNTLTAKVPDRAMSAAVIAAASWVALRKVVGRSPPAQRTTDVE